MPIVTTVVAAFLLAAFCTAQDVPEASPQVIQWLDKLESKGREIVSLQAKVQYDKTDELVKSRLTRTGDLLYLASDAAAQRPTRFAVLFNRYIADGKLQNQQLEYVFDGEWLVEKDHRLKRFEKRQIVAPGQASKVDPLSIDGPFPLPLGQKREEVLRRFDVSIVENDAAEAPNHAVHLRLVPRPDGQSLRERKKFDTVDIWFDRQTLLPVKVRTEEGAVATTVTLSQVKANDAPQADLARSIDTAPPAPGQGWRIEIKPWED